MKELWGLFRDRDALTFVVAIIGSVASSLFVAILSAKCWRSEEDETDGGFILGHTLSTLSCFGFMVSYLLTISSTEAKEKNATVLFGLAPCCGPAGSTDFAVWSHSDEVAFPPCMFFECGAPCLGHLRLCRVGCAVCEGDVYAAVWKELFTRTKLAA